MLGSCRFTCLGFLNFSFLILARKQTCILNLGLPSFLILCTIKCGFLAKRKLVWLRNKAMMRLVLPGDMGPSNPSLPGFPSDWMDSCSLLPSDWLASKEGPAGMRNQAPAAYVAGTAGKRRMNTAFLNPGCCHGFS